MRFNRQAREKWKIWAYFPCFVENLAVGNAADVAKFLFGTQGARDHEGNAGKKEHLVAAQRFWVVGDFTFLKVSFF